MSSHVLFLICALASLSVTPAMSSESCPKGEKRLRANEECIPASLFNYLYCLQQSGGGKIEVIRRSGDETAKSLEIQLSGKGSGVVIKGEGGGAIKTSDATKAARELQEKLDPSLTANCKYFANANAAKATSPVQPQEIAPRPPRQEKYHAEEETRAVAPPVVDDNLMVNEGSVRTLYAKDFCVMNDREPDKYVACYTGETLERCQGTGRFKNTCRPRPNTMHCYMSKAMGGMLNCYDDLRLCQDHLKKERDVRTRLRSSEPRLSKSCESFRLF